MQTKFGSLIVLALGFFFGAFAQAMPAPAAYECERNGELCAMIPNEKPVVPVVKASAPKPVQRSLLSPSDLKGGAGSIDNEFALSTALGDRGLSPNEDITSESKAFEEATRANEQVRGIEILLKGGPAANGNLGSISTLQKK